MKAARICRPADDLCLPREGRILPFHHLPLSFSHDELSIRLTGMRNPMLTLFHHPFCPHSRFVRVVAGEYGLNPTLIEERVWERRNDFLIINPAGTTPVLVEEGRMAVPGATIIAEYLDETRGVILGSHRLLPGSADGRVEVRRY
jgi:glutathione S-transferase